MTLMAAATGTDMISPVKPASLLPTISAKSATTGCKLTMGPTSTGTTSWVSIWRSTT